MAEFKFSCPSCGQRIAATEAYCGLQIPCPTCQKPLTVPPMVVSAPTKKTVPLATTTPVVPSPTPVAIPRPAKKKGKGLLLVIIALVVLAGAAAAFFFLKPKTEPTPVASNKPPVPVLQTNSPAQAAKGAEIMKKVTALYDTMTSFSANGEARSVIDMSHLDASSLPQNSDTPHTKESAKAMKAAMAKPQIIEATFKMQLARPDLYRIEWEQKNAGGTTKGATWSAGEGDFILFTPGGETKYARMTNQETAIAYASGLSGGAAGAMPELFFKNQYSLLNQLQDSVLEKEETIGGENCFVITGTTMGLKQILWINKKTYLIKQKQLVLGNELQISDQDDQKLKDSLKMLGEKEPSDKKVKETIKAAKSISAKMQGTMTETYHNIQINQTISKADFQYPVPAGVTLSSTLF